MRFAPLLRSELTKLLTVRRWLVALAAMALLTIGFGLLSAAGSSTNANEQPTFVVGPSGRAVNDQLYLVHGPVAGDATVTARVVRQRASHPDAQAGLMVRERLASGSRYVSIALTPGHGVRFDSNFGDTVRHAGGDVPEWLRLRRHGSEFRGEASADGSTWREVGRADLPGAGRDLEFGLFVNSPERLRITRTAGGTGVTGIPTLARATFADVRLVPGGAGTAAGWHGQNIPLVPRVPTEVPDAVGAKPGGVPPPQSKEDAFGRPAGTVTAAAGTYTLTGSGDIGLAEGPDDSVQASLFGTMFGLMALATVAVLFATSEYKRHLVWTTFAATPRRRPVLAAKAAVLAATTFALGLATSLAAYFVARPTIRGSGFTLPAYAPTSIGQPAVLRAIVGNAVLLVAFALLGLGLGVILRRSSAAIAIVFALAVVPLFAGAAVPPVSKWLMWLTPAGGFAIERAKPPSAELAEPWSQINPWLGLGIACAYAAVALGGAAWLLERRDA